MDRSRLAVLGAVAALLSWWAVPSASAQSVDYTKSAGGFEFSLGVIPAAVVRDTLVDHHAETMHGGLPRGTRVQHVMVAIFDRGSGQRVTGATVTARVEEPGHFGNERPLEPMNVAGAVSYGNYFPMAAGRPYEIRVRARIPGAPETVTVVFRYRVSSAQPISPESALARQESSNGP
jgi:hypothetical protein